MEGNVIAQLALLMWIPLALVLATSLPTRQAVLIVLVGGTLFLPERVAFDFPVVPPLDKQAISAIAAYLVCLIGEGKLLAGRANTAAARNVAILSVVGVVCTVVTNGEPVRYGRVVMPGMTTYDAVSFVINVLLRVVLPFYIGQCVFRKAEHLRELLRAFVIGGLIYVPLVLIEARLSPVFHLKIYGFFQHDFLQSMRAGGFRAFVFMSHGLAVAFFMAQALIALAGLGRTGDVKGLGLSPKLALAALVVGLISCKSMGAFIYAGIGVPLLWFASTKTQFGWARWLALLVLTYPLARLLEFIPTEWLLEKAKSISVDRAQSLEFRFDNEEILLGKAQLKPYFGWGSWGRNHVVNPLDGKPMTVADGEWIIQFGVGGAFGFLVNFGMLLLPVLRARKAALTRRLSEVDQRLLATATVILAFVGLDLIPNATFHALPYFIAGAVGSVAAGVLRGRVEPSAAPSSTSSNGALPTAT